MAATHGMFYWNELMTRDPAAAKAFYGDTLGWNFVPMEMPGGTYWVAIGAGETPVCGLYDMRGTDIAEVDPHWLSYIAVDDVDARVSFARTIGADVVRPPFDVDGVGRIAIVRDPEGAVTGWMTPAEQAS